MEQMGIGNKTFITRARGIKKARQSSRVTVIPIARNSIEVLIDMTIIMS